MSKSLQLNSYLKRFDISVKDVIQCNFVEYQNLSKVAGLYSIWQGDECIYVGKGSGKNGIRDRLKHHFNKAYGVFESGTRDTIAWRLYREKMNWNPSEWRVEMIPIDSHVERTLVEGIMMKVFDPLCNDENFLDRR